jgi:hypothetical protein
MLDLKLIFEVIATVMSVTGAVLVAYNTDRTRRAGFMVWIGSNIFWIGYGILGVAIGTIITFTTYMVCNVIATLRNGHEYTEIVCGVCGCHTGMYVKTDERDMVKYILVCRGDKHDWIRVDCEN